MSELTRYAQSGDISIAYQVAGEGALDVVLVPGGYTHLEHGQLGPLEGPVRPVSRLSKVISRSTP
jgi:hypothetical protein